MSQKESPTRSHEHVLEIQATPDEVWKAITDPTEIARWFAMQAETRPGKGGEIVYRWGELTGRCPILEWKPPAHLRTGWLEAPATPEGEGSALVVDWFLAGHGATTTLRLVHSGFGHDARWDKEYDGTKRGWTFELQGLKHYLERQRGKPRRATWARQVTELSPAAVWERFARPGRLFREVALDALGPGDRYRFVRVDGAVLEGRVLVNKAPLEFAGTLDGHGEGMLRFGFEDCLGAPEAHVWIATWDLGEHEFAALEASWKDLLARTFRA